MTIANTSAYPQFKNPDFAGSVATFALVVATAGLTATVWLSAAGIGAQPRGYMAALVDASPARVTLPRVEVVARRDAVASLADSVSASAGCAVEQTANRPG